MTVDDVFRVAEIHIASWRAAYAGIVPDEVLANLSAEKNMERRRAMFGQDDMETIVADVEGCLAGFAAFGASRDEDATPGETAELWAMYLHPDSWRQGIGKQLLEQVLRESGEHGFRQLTVWVLEENHAARRFYEAMGFRDDHLSKELIIGKPLTEVRYRREIEIL